MRARPRPNLLTPHAVALLGALAVGLFMGGMLLMVLPR